jgi:hypothetical protein
MKKSTAATAPSEPLPKVVSIDALRARRDEAALRSSATRTAPREESSSLDERMTESERDRLLEELRSELGDLPDVRLDKVIEARSKIARGYYDSERVRLDILGAMFEEERGPIEPAPQPVAYREEAARKSSTNQSSAKEQSAAKKPSTQSSSIKCPSTKNPSTKGPSTKNASTKNPSTKSTFSKKRPTKPRAR